MASRNQQSHAKRARELAVKEKRERKRAKRAALRAGEPWGEDTDADAVAGEGESSEGETEVDGESEVDGETIEDDASDGAS